MTQQAQSFPGAFCETCNKWREPNAVLPDGSCPRCGSQLDDHSELAAVGDVRAVGLGGASADAQVDKIPWHFWVMVAATVIYLGWRVIQGLGVLF